MRLTKKVEYGLAAVVRLAREDHTGRPYVQSREIAHTEELPAKFLESILLTLKSAGILLSKVGAGGGYRLLRDPNELYVSELIAALKAPMPGDDSDLPDTVEAGQYGRAAIAEVNSRLSAALEETIGSLTIANLVETAENRVGKIGRSRSRG